MKFKRKVFIGSALVFFGLLSFLVGFFFYQTEKEFFLQLHTYSQDSLFSINESGVKKFIFDPKTSTGQKITIPLCADTECSSFNDVKTFENLIYGYVEYQRVEVVKDSNNDLKEDWEVKVIDSRWSDFELPNKVSFRPEEGAKTLIDNLEEEIIEDIYLEGLNQVRTYDQDISERVGKTRVIVRYLSKDSVETLLGVGRLDKGEISGGDIFLITDKSEAEVAADLFDDTSSIERYVIYIIGIIVTSIGLYFVISTTKISSFVLRAPLAIGIILIVYTILFIAWKVSLFFLGAIFCILLFAYSRNVWETKKGN